MSEERPWTTREVAAHFRVQPPAVLAWVRAGKLKPARRRPVRRGAYLFNEADVLALEAEVNDPGPEAADVAAIINAELRLRKQQRGA